MRYATLPLIVAVLLGGLLLAGPAHARAAPYCSTETTVTPASAAQVRLALRDYRAAKHAFKYYQRARHCLGLPARARVAGRPDRAAPAPVWAAAADKWRQQRHLLQLKKARLLQRMKNPGGSSNGVRWLPLSRWVGWPPSAESMLAMVIMRESSGRERASNGGMYLGLLQIWRGHVSDPGHLFDAEYNLSVGLRLYLHSGWAPWAQTAY